MLVIGQPRYEALTSPRIAFLDVEGSRARALFTGALDLSAYDRGLAYTASGAEALRSCGLRDVLEGAPKPAPDVAISDHLWAPLVPAFGPRDRDPRVSPDAEALDAMRTRLAGRRPVVISPGSGGAAKRLPLAWWAEVAAHLDDVVWVGGPLEAGDGPWPEPRWDDLDLGGLVALAASCRAWLCPDSGPGHLARAVGAQVGVVFTAATSPATWAPPGARVFRQETAPTDVARWVAGL